VLERISFIVGVHENENTVIKMMMKRNEIKKLSKEMTDEQNLLSVVKKKDNRNWDRNF
jgi:hypothetical protein